ncbi:MAG: transposase [Rhodomicrobium sp.]|jgi:REP element-mobilizing transposase RayT
MPHRIANIIPKCRKKAVFRKIKKVFHGLARRRKCRIEEGHLMSDHVHMLVAIPPNTRLPASSRAKARFGSHRSGFLHGGKPQSFVCDIADIFKFETVAPTAFYVTAKIKRGKGERASERHVRVACRDSFHRSKLLDRIIPLIEDVLAAGGLERP